MDNSSIYDKVISKQYNNLNKTEINVLCNAIRNYPPGIVQQFNEYLQTHDHNHFWTIVKMKIFYIWLDKMVEYQQNSVTDDISNQNLQNEPIVVTFLYDIYAYGAVSGGSPRFNQNHKTVEKTRLLGKYVHYTKNMTKNVWNEMKTKLRKKIKDHHFGYKELKTIKIRIYCINIKTEDLYNSDEEEEDYIEHYDFCFKELTRPVIPLELI